MFGFGRKKKKAEEGVAQTFVEATGGGWRDIPEVVAVDGGEHADYVGEVLQKAYEYARETNVKIGEGFDYTLTDIPCGIVSPHEIAFGLMMRASDYGLSAGFVHDETANFTRLK